MTAAAAAAEAATAVVRRRSGGGEGDRNETRSPKKKIRFSLLALITCEERKIENS